MALTCMPLDKRPERFLRIPVCRGITKAGVQTEMIDALSADPQVKVPLNSFATAGKHSSTLDGACLLPYKAYACQQEERNVTVTFINSSLKQFSVWL